MLDKTGVRLDVAQPGGGRFAAVLPASALTGKNVESDVLGALGIEMERQPAELGDILPGGAAEQAGLKAGDRITSIDGKPVLDGVVLMQMIRASGGRTMEFGGSRAGQPLMVKVTPQVDPKTRVARISAHVLSAPEMVTVALGPVSAVAKGARTTWEHSAMTVKMIGKMMTGHVSLKNVTGPITIADYAGKTARMGAIEFLRFIAIISISLGVMNLLPIPVLDGGLLLYYSLEVLTGRPLPERIGELAQRAGVGLLFMLMALAVFNDVARLL